MGETEDLAEIIADQAIMDMEFLGVEGKKLTFIKKSFEIIWKLKIKTISLQCQT